MARLIFVNRFYWPNEPATAQLLTDLAESLVRQGHAVTVIASHPGRAGVPRTETRHGVRIVRIHATRWWQGGLAGKAVDYATFLAGALWQLARTARHGDVVVAMTDPPLLGIGVWLIAGLRGTRLIHWVQDIYPELAIELTGHTWLRVLSPLRNRTWRKADRCVTLGTDMATVLAGAGVPAEKIMIAPNWAPAGLSPQPAAAADALRAEWGLTGKFVIAYSGNLGRVHDLDPVLAVARVLRDSSEIAFLFVGVGPQRGALEAEVARLALTNVIFRPAQPRARLSESLALGDLHLVTLRPGCETYVFPSKLYGVVAVGRPVLCIGPRTCELARIVRDCALGLAFDRSETDALAEGIRRLAADPSERARLAAAAAHFAAGEVGADAAAARWDALLRELQAC